MRHPYLASSFGLTVQWFDSRQGETVLRTWHPHVFQLAYVERPEERWCALCGMEEGSHMLANEAALEAAMCDHWTRH